LADAIPENLKIVPSRTLELRLKRKDGGSVCVLLHAVPVIKDGQCCRHAGNHAGHHRKKTAMHWSGREAAKDRVVLDNIPDLIICSP
jgi:hypothetical protein